MLVMKFGGTSVSTKKNLEQISSILKNKNDNYLVVVSAFSQATNKLEKIAESALEGNYSRLLDEFRIYHFELVKEVFPVKLQTEVFILIQHKCNELEKICNGIDALQEMSEETSAKVLSFGEDLSSYILFKYLNENEVEVDHLNSRELIVANSSYLNAEVDYLATKTNVSKHVTSKNYIAAGFIASNHENENVVLGIGGSDFSAAIYANALNV
jgi:aspartokinase/homoserine dehydrogenase 1